MEQAIRPDQVRLADGRIYPKSVLWKKGQKVPGGGWQKKKVTEIEQLHVKQRKFAEMLASNKRISVKQYSKALGVCIATICKWKKLRPVQDLALEFYKKNNLLQHAIPIQEAVAKRAKQKGGSADARLYFDILKWMGILNAEDNGGKGSGDTFNVDKVLIIIQNENK